MATQFLTRVAKTCGGKKGRLLSKQCWQNWISPCRRAKLDLSLSPCTKKSIQSRSEDLV